MNWSARAAAAVAAGHRAAGTLLPSPLVYPELAVAVNPGMASARDVPNAEHPPELARQRAWEEGRAAGHAELQGKMEEQSRLERQSVLVAVEQFAIRRTEYFEKVESEVIQLALAIARKVLHRELHTDPLALLGLVRIALERVEDATGSVLRVSPQKAAAWRTQLSEDQAAGKKIEVIEDDALEADSCILETSMGTVDLSFEVQLKEIETGLMDLLAVRPETVRLGKPR